MKFKRFYFLIVTILTSIVAYANPVIYGAVASSSLSECEAISCSLIIESLIVSLLLYRYSFDVIRILYTWFLITLATFIVFYIFLGIIIFSLNFFDNMAPDILLISFGGLMVLFLEILVVWFEAKIMVYLSKKKFLRKNSAEPLKLRKAIYISAIANISSLFLGGILWEFFVH